MARFSLFLNGVKIKTIDDLRNNYNISDMLVNFKSKGLHRWLMCNGMNDELAKLNTISNSETDGKIISELFIVFAIPDAKQKELFASVSIKKGEKNFENEKIEDELTTACVRMEFMDYMDKAENTGKVLQFLRSLAKEGNAVAQLKLGWCFENAKGVDKDIQIAVEWYRIAAGQEYAPAQAALGDCYRDGIGVEKNVTEAINWYQRSASVERLYNIGNNYFENKDYLPALDCYLFVSSAGGGDASNQVGRLYDHGWGIEKNPQKAAYYYQLAMQQGSDLGKLNYGWCFLTGFGVEKNYKKAFPLYKDVAENGNPHAQKRLGDFYRDGIGCSIDLENAFTWYSKAAKQGNDIAKKNIAYLLQIRQMPLIGHVLLGQAREKYPSLE